MKTFISLLLLCLLLPALAEETVTMGALLTGTVAPLAITGKDLVDPGWFRFTAGGGMEGGNSAMFMAMGGQGGTPNVFFTQGRVVAVAPNDAQRYLIAYTRPAQKLDLADMMRRGEPVPPPAPITATTRMPLALLDLRSLGSLKEIRAIDPRTDLITDKAALNLYEQERIKALQNTSLNNLRQLAIAAMMFVQDHDETFMAMTDAASFRNALKPYDGNERLWLQPIVEEQYLPNVTLSKKALGDIQNPTEIILIYEPKPWPDGKRAAAFVDGHVEFMDDARWKTAKAKSGMK